MKKSIAALAAFLFIATVAVAAFAAPAVVPWEVQTYTVVNPAAVPGDTLARGTAADTVQYVTSAIPIFGARAFVIEAQSDTLNPTTGLWVSSVDTLATPGVVFDVSGTGSYAPLSNSTITGIYVAGSLNITTAGRIIGSFYSSMDAVGGGTPIPLGFRYMKLRLMHNTQRFKGYTSAQILAVNGPAYNKTPRVTIRVHVLY